MSDDTGHEEHSHYEISLTAGQAFVAFVLLLLSLAASFGFGIMIGRSGQGEDRVVVRKEPPVVTEASVIPKKSGKIVELGVADSDFKATTSETDTASTAAPVLSEGAAPANGTAPAAVTPVAGPASAPANEPVISPAESAAAKPAAAPAPSPVASRTPAGTKPEPVSAARSGPVYAQLLSTADQKTAEALATKLINRGFTSAYVDRASNEKGPVFRVRVSFASEADARAAEAKLKEFAKDVWIVK